MLKAKLGIGPMSTEIVEAVFRYSHFYRTELMLISSKSQIDYNGGYVNSWTTKQYCEFIKEMKKKYQFSNVKICRDHCGPGFNGKHDLQDTYNTIKNDIENGFDLIHIDFCNFKGNKEEMMKESKKAIEYALNLNPKILLEIGTDENRGLNITVNDIETLEEEIEFFKSFCNPEFYVVQTGSLVKEINQVGTFNRKFIERVSQMLHNKGLKLKEHNADYLSKEEIQSRQGIVDAMNIAPQLGVVQTYFVLNRCLVYGIKFDNFLETVYNGGKWKKWMINNEPTNKLLCSLIAGHYHFYSEEYKKLIEELSKHEDIKEKIIEIITEVINHYGSCQ